MEAASPARNQRMTMEELLLKEKESQAQLQHVYCKSLSFKDVVETKDMQREEGKTWKETDQKKKCQESATGKQLSESSSSLSSFMRSKTTKFSFRKWKINKRKNVVKVDGNVGEVLVKKKEEGSISIGRSSDRKSGVGEGGVKERDGEKEEGGEFELCKKRILMGEKCKPLNISGSLRYDESGILLPEEISMKGSS